MSYWAVENWQVVYADERTFSLTFTDTAGDPVDISSYTFYYKAESDYTTDTIELDSLVVGLEITKTDSGTGTTDTANIIMSEANTAITLGEYKHHLVAVVSSATVTLVRGKLTVVSAQVGI